VSAVIYSLCALTAALCAVLLLRGYRRTRAQMLFWSGLCFVGLTASNVLLVLDRIVLPTVDLSIARLSVALVALLLLIYGLVMGED
jgi:hydrogenase/urease accessory protein HupE